jgi:magnesium chelatase subunit D
MTPSPTVTSLMVGQQAWSDAALSAVLFAIDPVGTGGVMVHSGAGPVRDQWLHWLQVLMPPGAPHRRMPVGITDERLLGGLDLGATLSAGKVVAMRGLLADADGGTLVVAMAERLSVGTAARITAAMDQGHVSVERDGSTHTSPTRIGVVAFDESVSADEAPPAALADRLAFRLDLTAVRPSEALPVDVKSADVQAARARLPSIALDDQIIEALCAAAGALGVASVRGALLALNVARTNAALEGRDRVSDVDAAVAARLVLGPRATQVPTMTDAEPEETPPADTDDDPTPGDDHQPPPPSDTPDGAPEPEQSNTRDQALEDVVLAAAKAAIPAHLLASLRLSEASRGQSKTSGKSGVAQTSKTRGRPIGASRGEPRAGVRLNVIETLRAAAPWQRIRARDGAGSASAKIHIRRDDFRVTRFKHRNQTTTIFVVDASGSAALYRLAEAKGCVELLLADCYVRRDSVAMVSFRGKQAELLLPPTRSLARAKRSLAGLPGGGGTPLASAIDAAFLLAQSIVRKQETPVIVFLTDGRANIARDGAAGRPKAEEDAFLAARQIRGAGLTALLVDTSPQPTLVGQRLADELGARYLGLPYADARVLSQAIKAAGPISS